MSRATGEALYPRLLGLQHVYPSAWQRAVLFEGSVGAAVLLVLADLASAWTLVVLPLVVAGLVKSHDVLEGMLVLDSRPAIRGTVAGGAPPPTATSLQPAGTPRAQGPGRQSW